MKPREGISLGAVLLLKLGTTDIPRTWPGLGVLHEGHDTLGYKETSAWSSFFYIQRRTRFTVFVICAVLHDCQSSSSQTADTCWFQMPVKIFIMWFLWFFCNVGLLDYGTVLSSHSSVCTLYPSPPRMFSLRSVALHNVIQVPCDTS